MPTTAEVPRHVPLVPTCEGHIELYDTPDIVEGGASATIPEPNSIWVLIGGTHMALLFRRRQSQRKPRPTGQIFN